METALDKSGTHGKQDGYASRSRALACIKGTELDRELVRRGSRSPTSSFALASRFCSAQRTRYRLKFAGCGCGVVCITRHDRGSGTVGRGIAKAVENRDGQQAGDLAQVALVQSDNRRRCLQIYWEQLSIWRLRAKGGRGCLSQTNLNKWSAE
jgi:hypothetical protein